MKSDFQKGVLWCAGVCLEALATAAILVAIIVAVAFLLP